MDTVKVQKIGLAVRPQALNLEGTQAMKIIEAELRGQLAKARLQSSRQKAMWNCHRFRGLQFLIFT
jgi:hypothetical protein